MENARPAGDRSERREGYPRDNQVQRLRKTTSRPDVTYEELLELARELEGRTLETVRGRRFRTAAYLDSIVFVPESSGLGQSDGRKAGERFVARFNEIGSLRPSDYSDVTRNASYYVGLLMAGNERRGAAG